ncbi:MAG: response regulator [Ferruginibacter sp.]
MEHATEIRKKLFRVLIIEDEGDICYLLKSVLMNRNLEIEHVNTIAQASVFLKEEQPDLIFLDNYLPDGLGVNYIENIKADYPSTKIIMITAHDTASDKKRALGKGADIFLSKPFTKEQIYRSIDLLLNTSAR